MQNGLPSTRPITHPSTGPCSSKKLLPSAYRDDVKRDVSVSAVLSFIRPTHSLHHLRQVTAAVSVQIWSFLHRLQQHLFISSFIIPHARPIACSHTTCTLWLSGLNLECDLGTSFNARVQAAVRSQLGEFQESSSNVSMQNVHYANMTHVRTCVVLELFVRTGQFDAFVGRQ